MNVSEPKGALVNEKSQRVSRCGMQKRVLGLALCHGLCERKCGLFLLFSYANSPGIQPGRINLGVEES